MCKCSGSTCKRGERLVEGEKEIDDSVTWGGEGQQEMKEEDRVRGNTYVHVWCRDTGVR